MQVRPLFLRLRPIRAQRLRRLWQFRAYLHDVSVPAHLEILLGRARRKQVLQQGDPAGPARLMARAEPSTIVTVEVLESRRASARRACSGVSVDGIGMIA